MNKWEMIIVSLMFIVFSASISYMVYHSDYGCGKMYNIEDVKEYIDIPEEVIRDMDIA